MVDIVNSRGAEVAAPEGLNAFYRAILIRAAEVCAKGYVGTDRVGTEHVVATRCNDKTYVATMYRDGRVELPHDFCQVEERAGMATDGLSQGLVYIDLYKTESEQTGVKTCAETFFNQPMSDEQQEEFQSDFLASEIDYELTRNMYERARRRFDVISVEWPSVEFVGNDAVTEDEKPSLLESGRAE